MVAGRQSAQRVAVLIDTQNLYHSAKHLHRSRVNFTELLSEAVGGRNLVRAIAYVIRTEGEEERPFFDALDKMGIERREKDLQVFFSGEKKADWDVGLTVDAMTLAPKVDTIVLATGDGDFVPLVHHLRLAAGCRVEIFGFGRSTSAALREAADLFVDLDDDPERFVLPSPRHRNKRPLYWSNPDSPKDS